jgi:hypothetical protein
MEPHHRKEEKFRNFGCQETRPGTRTQRSRIECAFEHLPGLESQEKSGRRARRGNISLDIPFNRTIRIDKNALSREAGDRAGDTNRKNLGAPLIEAPSGI